MACDGQRPTNSGICENLIQRKRTAARIGISLGLLLAFAMSCSLTASICDAIEEAVKGVVSWAVSQVCNRAETVMPSIDRYPVGFT